MTDQPTRSTSLYGRYAAGAAENYEHHFVPAIGRPCARRLLARARPAPGERVIDVACGTGIAARLAREAVGPGGVVEGLDANPAMIGVARATRPDVTWHIAPAEDMPLPDAAFDLALCAMGLQFFPDKPAALREMHRVLVPGGRVAVSTPGPTPPLFRAIDEALTDHVGPGASMFIHGVFSLHDPTEVRLLLESAGFVDVDVETRPISLRVAPPAEFFWQYVRSTPLAAITADLDEPTRTSLERAVVERCRPFTDGESAVVEPGMLVATGSRSSGQST